MAIATGIGAMPAIKIPTANAAGWTWRCLFTFPAMLTTALAALVYALANRSIGDPDIWWHLRNAEYLVTTGRIVRADMYSFTTAEVPWINHEWLAELPYYFAYRWLGYRGLFLLFVLLLEIILLGVFYLATLRSGNVKAGFLTSWIAVYLATVSFGPRTLLFGWIFLIVELLILARFQQGRDHLLWLPLLFLVWVNSHGSWLIGMVLLLGFVAAGCVRGDWGRIHAPRWSGSQAKRLALACVLSLAALFVNPYGYLLVGYPFNLAFRQKLNISNVQEWQSLDFHSLRGKMVMAMLAATLLLALARRSEWLLTDLFLLCVAFYSALTYTRFLFLAAILFTPLLARELNALPPVDSANDKPALNALLMAGLLASVFLRLPSEAKLVTGTADEYPVQAAAFLKQFQPQGPVLNDYDWGGYLIWNARQVPVFVDSRVDIYEYCGVLKDYIDLASMQQPLEVLDRYHIRYVLFARKSAVAYLLRHTAGWKLDYADVTTELFERDPTGAPNAPLIVADSGSGEATPPR
jgi:hypothetical protein